MTGITETLLFDAPKHGPMHTFCYVCRDQTPFAPSKIACPQNITSSTPTNSCHHHHNEEAGSATVTDL